MSTVTNAIATDATVAQEIDNMTHAGIELSAISYQPSVTPEIAAAQDPRVLDIIENHLLDCQYNVTMTDDLVLTIQEYLIAQNSTTQAALALIADMARLRGVFKMAQKIKNSPEFKNLVALNTPDEEVSEISVHEASKPEVVATVTTAKQLLSTVTDTPQDIIDAHKPAKGAKKSTKTQKPAKPAKAPKKAKVSPKHPMPAIASIADIEALDRKALVAAMVAVKSNHPDITVPANSKSTVLQQALAANILGIKDYQPTVATKATKATKGKTEAILDLPEGLTWDECKNMKYRQLQQVCKALRSQGLFQGNIGGKGATTENLLKGCADYFRSQGVDIVEVAVSPSKTPKADLNLPNLAKVRESQRLERETTKALKLSNEDAKVALELAVAA